jgi:uncharacterized membrane protein
MHKGRLEAFSDGVIAILITIMVLELRTPKGSDLSDLRPLLPVLCGYALSFIFLAIYWNNHHHMFQVVERVSGSVLWANAHLLFWLSLVPFSTAWMGEYPLAAWPIAAYGANLLLCAIAYYILVRALLSEHSPNSILARAIGDDFKGKISLVPYLVAIPLAFSRPALSYVCFAAVAILWLVPDKRMVRALGNHGNHGNHSGVQPRIRGGHE